jgi:aryl-alcohol dehydrogenase-like predicted oxidoreductase
MRYRQLGRSGLRVSCVSLGSWLTLGLTVDQSATNRLVARARELGVNLFDTADVYHRGEGEKALGAALAGHRRQQVVIATKCFFPMSDDPNDRGLSRKHVHESIDQSLVRLRTDYVDLYQCHRPDPDVPLEETAMAMDDLIRRGKVLYWGVSMWPAALIERAVRLCQEHGWHAPISNQPVYNLLEREIEAEVLPACEELGVGQIVFSPLAQGVLTGKYRAGRPPAPGTRAADARVNQFIGKWLTPERLASVERFAGIAKELGQPPAVVALAWCLQRGNVASVIAGATSPAQLEQNCLAAELDLDPPAVQRIEAAFA